MTNVDSLQQLSLLAEIHASELAGIAPVQVLMVPKL